MPSHITKFVFSILGLVGLGLTLTGTVQAGSTINQSHSALKLEGFELSHHTKKSKGKKKSVSYKPVKQYIHTRYKIDVKVDLKRQRMFVYKDGKLSNTWKISGGTKSYPTPTGRFGPTRMYPMFYATNWNRAEMPHSIFFRGAYAIHGTKSVSKLGRPASHGCVRLSPSNAKKLYGWVKKAGTENVQIEVRASL